jgi:hypothetical protein
MTLIKISDLTTTDNESVASADSFLNELQKAQTTQIFGGWRGGSWSNKGGGDSWKKDGGDNWKKDDCDYKKVEKCDDSYYYKEKRYNKYHGGWNKDC